MLMIVATTPVCWQRATTKAGKLGKTGVPEAQGNTGGEIRFDLTDASLNCPQACSSTTILEKSNA
jgi:hypothetical protein